LLNSLIRIKDGFAIRVLDQANREPHVQLALLGLMMGASYEPTLHDMKLCFVEDAFQPEMKTILIIARLVHSGGLRDQGAAYSADIKELIPFPIVSRQASGLDGHHQADPAFTHLPPEFGESITLPESTGAVAEIFIQDLDAFRWPSQRFHETLKFLLPLLAFEIFEDLGRRGLPYIHTCQAIPMC